MDSFLIFWKTCYLGDAIGASWGADDTDITRIRSELNNFRVLVSLLTCRSLAVRPKSRLYFACNRSVMLK